MREFTYVANPARVIFGSGSIENLPAEAQRLGLRRVLVLSTKEQKRSAEQAAALLGPSCAAVFPGAVMHTPVAVTEEAVAVVATQDIDGIVAIGGGSTIGLGKAIALRTDLPQIVVPTTYAGSEVTPIIGETADGIKRTQTTTKVLPEVVIYDVELTVGLPPSLSATSGINAIAHAVEALYAKDGNPIIDMMAVEGVRVLAASLPRIARDPTDREARAEAQYGAWLCGTCLGSVGMSLHHKLCHTLGGTFGLPHAETHTIVLPHALAYNASAAPEAMRRIARALEAKSAQQAVYDLARDNGAPVALRDIGMKEADLDLACEHALKNQYPNPRPLERGAIRALLQNAWEGVRP